jgi:prophage antirepressor-like protein
MINNSLQLITSENFYNSEANFYRDENNDIWMTIEQVANCLQYASRKGIDMMMAKYEYLKESEFSTHQNLWSMGGGRTYETTLISEDGIYEVTMLSHKPKAKEFRAFVRKLLKAIRKKEITLYHSQSSELQIIELKQQNMRLESKLDAQAKHLQRIENILWTIAPSKPYNAWKSKMTPIINALAAKHDTTFNAITHQIYYSMKTDYGIPLDEYQQTLLRETPNATKIAMYDTVAIHTEIHSLFEELLSHYAELFQPVATAVAIQFPV